MSLLNANSPLPLYHQLAEILSNRIKDGKYQPGQKIPSEPELSKMFGIGRPTVRQAIDLLARRGLLLRQRGSGTFVNEQKSEINLFSLAGTTSAFQEKGVSVQTRVVEPIKLITIEDDNENPFSRRQAYFYSRLSLADQMPTLIEDMYLNPDVFRDFETNDVEKESLSRVAKEKYFMEPTSCRQNFTIAEVSEEKAGWLDLKTGSPILLVNRYLNFDQMDNAIFSKLYCRTDRFVFSQVIGGNSDA